MAQQGGVAERKAIIDRAHALSVKMQVQLAGISRGSVYYRRKSVNAIDLGMMR
ncbi:MAG: hypothetical protein KJ630_01730 [Proteobacteria bacterium]|nr:hypothetical protein [Pseudomonadota bacterium]